MPPATDRPAHRWSSRVTSRIDPLPLAERSFGGWQNPGQQAVVTQVPTAGAPRLILVDRPGAVQADIGSAGSPSTVPIRAGRT